MIRQYGPTVCRSRTTMTPRGPMECGCVPVGTVYRKNELRDGAPPIIVEAWLPRDYATYAGGKFTTKRIRGGHIAIVRRLDNGKQFELSDCWLLPRDDH